MLQRAMLCAAALALLAACGESGDAEERYFEHYEESVERAEAVRDQLQEADEQRRRNLEDHDS